MKLRGFIGVLFLAALSACDSQTIETRPFVRGSWHQLLAAHADKPTIVHFWGLTCAPCLTELPHWAEMQRDRPGMNVVMIASDPASEDTEELTATLAEAKLNNVESWAFADAFHEKLRFEIDPTWRGEMPRTMLIGRDGKARVMSGVADLQEIRNWYDAQTKS